MTVSVSARVARIGSRVRFGILLALAQLIGHDVVYAARFGFGVRLSATMTSLGHDSWWGSFTVAAVMAAIGLGIASVTTIWLLTRLLAGDKTPDELVRRLGTPSGYADEFRALWPRLFGAVLLGFTIQENFEIVATHGLVPGIDVLVDPGFPITVVALAVVTAALAAVGAIIRWRIDQLRHRLRAALELGRSRPRHVRPAREWASIDAAAPHRWTLDRRDAGRAPPPSLRPMRLATA